MPRKKKENLVHFDIDSLSKQTEKKVLLQPATLGQTLQFKREKKKLSLQDVSEKLCIKEIYLRALENGHYYAFPSRVYGIGFLRSYAKFLGLDSDTLVAQFHQETADIKEEPMDMLVIEKHIQLPSRKTLWIVFALLCIFGLIWFVAHEILTPDSFLSVKLPSWNKTSEVVQDQIDTTQEVPVLADELVVPQESVVEPVKSIDVEQPKGMNPVVFSAQVAFVATRDVWVELTDTQTGKKILSKALGKNEHFIPSVDLSVLTLSTGRPGLVLYQNGQKVKTFGTEKNLSLAESVAQD